MNKVILTAHQIKKSYSLGTHQLEILKGVDFEIRQGEAVGIVGASGAGKSTLLHILGTLDQPDSGELYFESNNLLAMDDTKLSLFRNQKMGFVFQSHHVMSEMTAIENVMLPGRIAGDSPKLMRLRAEEMFDYIGLRERSNHYPSELSGGELQRVAIARALYSKPEILFADEPTGNLDSQNSLKIQDLFFNLQQQFQLSLIVVTHDRQFASRFPRCLEMKDGHWK